MKGRVKREGLSEERMTVLKEKDGFKREGRILKSRAGFKENVGFIKYELYTNAPENYRL